MRTVINFTVYGENVDDLKTKALDVYREVTGDPDAAFPHSATLEVKQDDEAEDRWYGEVTVTEQPK